MHSQCTLHTVHSKSKRSFKGDMLPPSAFKWIKLRSSNKKHHPVGESLKQTSGCVRWCCNAFFVWRKRTGQSPRTHIYISGSHKHKKKDKLLGKWIPTLIPQRNDASKCEKKIKLTPTAAAFDQEIQMKHLRSTIFIENIDKEKKWTNERKNTERSETLDSEGKKI